MEQRNNNNKIRKIIPLKELKVDLNIEKGQLQLHLYDDI